ncbi:SecDF P1 head subdomain-containing protein [Gracilibacillus lacisalsi]|uniref:SecDF P1 head subdomain-containing protein n=1 Tax=Gracilibacillus lacisalsi TaxID=393087 RepID=UPI0003762D11|nr:hypothetical protein [Gracilibacillus lacisalsi]
MNKPLYCLLIVILFLFLLSACATTNKGVEPTKDETITIQNDEGDILASTSDFTKAKLEDLEQSNQSVIELSFREEGKLEEITESHTGKSIYLYFGEELISSPMIVSTISGTDFVIKGDYTEETANQIIDSINNQS